MGDLPELPKPSIRVDASGDILPTDGRRFVMGDFYTADQLREAVRQEREAVLAAILDTWRVRGSVDELSARRCWENAIRARSEQ